MDALHQLQQNLKLLQELQDAQHAADRAAEQRQRDLRQAELRTLQVACTQAVKRLQSEDFLKQLSWEIYGQLYGNTFTATIYNDLMLIPALTPVTIPSTQQELSCTG